MPTVFLEFFNSIVTMDYGGYAVILSSKQTIKILAADIAPAEEDFFHRSYHRAERFLCMRPKRGGRTA